MKETLRQRRTLTYCVERWSSLSVSQLSVSKQVGPEYAEGHCAMLMSPSLPEQYHVMALQHLLQMLRH
jgi:hypothetical protein